MTAPAWAPAPDAVGDVIARLVPDPSGLITGHFSTGTIPTDTQVTRIIGSVAAEVALLVPSVPDAAATAAARVVALGVALQVAVAYFPEVTAGYVGQLRSDYLDARGLLVSGVQRLLSDDAGGSAVQVLPIHSTRPLPPSINPYQNPYVDPMWPY